MGQRAATLACGSFSLTSLLENTFCRWILVNIKTCSRHCPLSPSHRQSEDHMQQLSVSGCETTLPLQLGWQVWVGMLTAPPLLCFLSCKTGENGSPCFRWWSGLSECLLRHTDCRASLSSTVLPYKITDACQITVICIFLNNKYAAGVYWQILL